MKEFVLIFRMDITTKEKQPTADQVKIYMDQWMAWISDIADRNQLAGGGNHLSAAGKLLKPGNLVEDGPYAINNESVAGYIIILARDINDATAIAGACPILRGEGNSVEVRQTATPGEMNDVKRA